MSIIAPLFDLLPRELAMPELCPKGPRLGPARDWVERQSGQFAPAVQAGLWLYVDDLHRSHEISQGISGPTGAYWHAIMHRREGDHSNAKYWFRQVGQHPALVALGIDPFEFVDECQRDAADRHEELVAMQRREWENLMNACLMEAP